MSAENWEKKSKKIFQNNTIFTTCFIAGIIFIAPWYMNQTAVLYQPDKIAGTYNWLDNKI